MKYNPEVWGPHYWFFLHTIARNYPEYPNDVTKRKYYDLIINLPLFIPNEDICNYFTALLDRFPVTPYLTNRESFKKWMHLIHNKINSHLGKEEIPFWKSEEIYESNYIPKVIHLSERLQIQKHHITFLFVLILIIIIYILYKE